MSCRLSIRSNGGDVRQGSHAGANGCGNGAGSAMGGQYMTVDPNETSTMRTAVQPMPHGEP